MERLLVRFVMARNCIGKSCRRSLTSTYDFYRTNEGQKYLISVSQAVSDGKRGNVDKVEQVNVDLEKIAGIESEQEGSGQTNILIKDRLLCRFVTAKNAVGRYWRQALMTYDPFLTPNAAPR